MLGINNNNIVIIIIILVVIILLISKYVMIITDNRKIERPSPILLQSIIQDITPEVSKNVSEYTKIDIDVDKLAEELDHKMHGTMYSKCRSLNNLPRSQNIVYYIDADSWNANSKKLVNHINKCEYSTIYDGVSMSMDTLSGKLWINGNMKSRFLLPVLYDNNTTLCYVMKYSGNNKNRILTGDNTDWLSGFHNGKSGVAFHGHWLTRGVPETDEKIIGIDMDRRFYANGIERTIDFSSSFEKPVQLGINIGKPSDKEIEHSEFGIAEIIMYNTKLTSDEVKKVFDVLNARHNVYNEKELNEKKLCRFKLKKLSNERYAIYNHATDTFIQMDANNGNVRNKSIKEPYEDFKESENSSFQYEITKLEDDKFEIRNVIAKRNIGVSDKGLVYSKDTIGSWEKLLFISTTGTIIDELSDGIECYILTHHGTYIKSGKFKNSSFSVTHNILLDSPTETFGDLKQNMNSNSGRYGTNFSFL
ncbi:hypothetical protein [Heterosigma akashiwo virus 01]|uniref:Uncharacterized protein n=1 Tax=Heterosigma akashiwo virus 01 TaxID=97195 RepID=A0A1C9C5B5_HAV01|nr:hypothetical protein D1R72_gp150 [Heterosigma akashiwo virus 01]AOM63481.1 hypothetical protein [Heterosigma akashiwo virus 01]